METSPNSTSSWYFFKEPMSQGFSSGAALFVRGPGAKKGGDSTVKMSAVMVVCHSASAAARERRQLQQYADENGRPELVRAVSRQVFQALLAREIAQAFGVRIIMPGEEGGDKSRRLGL